MQISTNSYMQNNVLAHKNTTSIQENKPSFVAGNEEKVASSQIDIENNITNLDSITQEETKSTATINKNITTITSNLKTSHIIFY